MTDWRARPTSGATLGGGTDGWIEGDGVRLHFVERGSGPLVVLLHGFPEFWYGWRHQLPVLASAGYRAVALDLRGYNLSERPPRVEDYTRERLAADVAAAIARLGGRAHAVVGHDWGGIVAWRLSVRHAERLERLVVLNAPHPGRYRELARTPGQLGRSWYVGAIQIPVLPELLLRRGDFAPLVRVLRAEHSRGHQPSEHEIEAYRASWRVPGALTAALSYYRALKRALLRGPATDHATTSHPTLVVCGMRDGALVPGNVDRLERWAPDLRVVRVDEARHFVQSDAPDAVNDALLRFLSR